ncbi:fibronectin type III domain-containing protein [Sulfurovum sp. CS9]|uniref:fibronectin type III domain-containing protein n=1 Tax=Sulfurovum sp. CS9 TaxID=3391146 RepID=UPI0039EBEF1C
MKKSILLLSVLALIIFNGCGGIKGLMIYDTDPTLKSITQVRALPMMSSVGFEWEKIKDRRIHGINIYRKVPSNQEDQEFKRIGSIGNRYATHFVDTHVKPNTKYLYTFTTFALGKESKRSTVLRVTTRPTFAAVSFVKAYKEAPGVVKLLWRPHPSQRVNAYIIERSVNDGTWKYMSQVEGQLMAEYIDTFVRSGNTYAYRIIAKSYDNIRSKASQATQISL